MAGSGHACFSGVDNGTAAGCDEEESVGLLQREPGNDVTDFRHPGRVGGVASELGAGSPARGDGVEGCQASDGPATFEQDLLPALITSWPVLRAPAGKLLAPMLPTLVPLLRPDGELDLGVLPSQLC